MTVKGRHGGDSEPTASPHPAALNHPALEARRYVHERTPPEILGCLGVVSQHRSCGGCDPTKGWSPRDRISLWLNRWIISRTRAGSVRAGCLRVDISTLQVASGPWRSGLVGGDLSTTHGVDGGQQESASGPTSGVHRVDLDGLRALAVLLVVLFHAGVPLMSGGFVGVDVFFVLSGYLITGLLLRESETRGGLALSDFWAKRARRLLPAATVVILATLLAGVLLSSPLRWESLAAEAAASTGYVANFYFGSQAKDYFAPAVETSPLLHMWSLSVEEQFYLVWPILLLFVMRWRPRTADAGRRVAVVSGIVVVTCFALSVALVDRGTPWAYFATASRGWELGVGAWIATLHYRGWLPGARVGVVARRWGEAMSWLGLGLVVGAAAIYSGSTPFPGIAAAVPVAGATLIIARPPDSGGLLHRLLGSGPVQWLGHRSYSWYLWHWPVLIIAGWVWGDLPLAARLWLVGVALVPAAAMYRWVEQPIRFLPRLLSSRRLSLSLGAGLMVICLLACAAVWSLGRREMSQPLLVELAAAREDRPGYLLVNGCDQMDAEWLKTNCVAGAGPSSPLIVVVGDSHAEHWAPAVDEAAAKLGLGMVVLRKSSCPFVPVDVVLGVGGRDECSRWQRDVTELIEQLEPEVVLTSNSAAYVATDGAAKSASGSSVTLDEWRRATAETAAWLSSRKIAFGLIHDTPRFERDPIECVAKHRSVEPCEATRQEATRGLAALRAAELAGLAEADAGAGFDPIPHLCEASTCSIKVGGAWAYSDSNHLSGAGARALLDPLGDWLSGWSEW